MVSTIIQKIAMITTHAQQILAIPQPEIAYMWEKTVMIMMHVQPTLATNLLDNALILLIYVQTTINAQKIHAIPF
jgi:putative ribosome biogenesis GTPase RsgA